MLSDLALAASVMPATLPAEPCDVVIRCVMRNAGRSAIKVAPDAAKLAAIASFAGIGITWGFGFDGPAEVRVVELRTYYGPPGNPPGPAYVTKSELELAPGGEHAVPFAACWIPNSNLTDEQLSKATLDPMGMDNLSVSTTSSVLVMGATWKQVSAKRAHPELLRGHVVAFFTLPGAYQLRVRYWQHPFIKVGEKHDAASPPFTLHVP